MVSKHTVFAILRGACILIATYLAIGYASVFSLPDAAMINHTPVTGSYAQQLEQTPKVQVKPEQENERINLIPPFSDNSVRIYIGIVSSRLLISQ